MDVNYCGSIDFSSSQYVVYNLGILFWVIFLTIFGAMNIYVHFSWNHEKLTNLQVSTLKKTKIQPEKFFE